MDEDEEDEGGEEGLRLGRERGETTGLTELRRKRMFEIEMITGDVQTFEVSFRNLTARSIPSVNLLTSLFCPGSFASRSSRMGRTSESIVQLYLRIARMLIL